MPEITRNTPPGTITVSAELTERNWERQYYGHSVILVVTGPYDVDNITSAVYVKRFAHASPHPHYAVLCNALKEVEEANAISH